MATVGDIRHEEGLDWQGDKGEARAHVGLLVRVDALVVGEAAGGAVGAKVDDVGVCGLSAAGGVVGGGYCEDGGGEGGGGESEGGEGGDGEEHCCGGGEGGLFLLGMVMVIGV